MKSLARATLKNPKISFLIGKNFEIQPKTNTQKPNIESMDELENLCLNLSFNVENR